MFRCWTNIAETVIYSELGSSVAIHEAGFNLDSLMLRYQARTCSVTQSNCPPCPAAVS